VLRHGNAPEIIDNHSPEPRLPAKKRHRTVAVRAASVSSHAAIERDPAAGSKRLNRTTAPFFRRPQPN
jgi:hypothetical protein